MGRFNALWTASFVAHLLRGAQNVRAGRPDVIIAANKHMREFGLKEPAGADAFADFAKTRQASEIEIWTRKEP